MATAMLSRPNTFEQNTIDFLFGTLSPVSSAPHVIENGTVSITSGMQGKLKSTSNLTKILAIKRYFQEVLWKHKAAKGIRFPSLKALSGFFNATIDDILTALNELSQMGFEYDIQDARKPIQIRDALV